MFIAESNKNDIHEDLHSSEQALHHESIQLFSCRYAGMGFRLGFIAIIRAAAVKSIARKDDDGRIRRNTRRLIDVGTDDLAAAVRQ